MNKDCSTELKSICKPSSASPNSTSQSSYARLSTARHSNDAGMQKNRCKMTYANAIKCPRGQLQDLCESYVNVFLDRGLSSKEFVLVCSQAWALWVCAFRPFRQNHAMPAVLTSKLPDLSGQPPHISRAKAVLHCVHRMAKTKYSDIIRSLWIANFAFHLVPRCVSVSLNDTEKCGTNNHWKSTALPRSLNHVKRFLLDKSFKQIAFSQAALGAKGS